MIVYKFGGASVKNSDGIRNLSKIVSEANAPICVVVSAMGKTTNALECVVRTLFDGRHQKPTNCSTQQSLCRTWLPHVSWGLTHKSLKMRLTTLRIRSKW